MVSTIEDMAKVKVDYTFIPNYHKIFGVKWVVELQPFLSSNYTFNMMLFLHELYKTKYMPLPRKSEVFEVFKLINPLDVRCVVLGDEPFNNTKGSGVAFATRESQMLRPSLVTVKIEKCIERTIYDGCKINFDLTLSHWMKQGVLPLNVAMTTNFASHNTHIDLWSNFTREVLKSINKHNSNVIFILLGDTARSFKPLINENRHYVLEYKHPSESVRDNTQWNCEAFKRANQIIATLGGANNAIKW